MKKMVKPCWKPSADGDGGRRGGGGGGDSNGRTDGLLWCKDLGTHISGEFSMAVIQANSLLEDQSQLISGPLSSLNSGPCGTFVGVYDGHGGSETSRFVNETLFLNLKKFASEHQDVSASVVKRAFLATEEEFLSLVREQWHTKPQIASVGTCCLVGIICNGLLYVANAGDSRVVLGRAERNFRGVTAIQLSTEHNASIESVRDELYSLHPDDSQIVVLKHKVWRVKGIIQISRSIGDAYLKKQNSTRYLYWLSLDCLGPSQSQFLIQSHQYSYTNSTPRISFSYLHPTVYGSILATKRRLILSTVTPEMESLRDLLMLHFE